MCKSITIYTHTHTQIVHKGLRPYPNGLVLTLRQKRRSLLASHCGSDLDVNQLLSYLHVNTPLISRDLSVCQSNVNGLMSPRSTAQVSVCVSFTVCVSCSSIHTHLETQVAKHSTQARYKLQENDGVSSPDASPHTFTRPGQTGRAESPTNPSQAVNSDRNYHPG